MKLNSVIVIFLSLLLTLVKLEAQPSRLTQPVLPVQLNYSPIFGNDIVINNNALQDQKNVVFCSASNGWLYAGYSHNVSDMPYITILKSTDNGLTWTVLLDDAGSFFPGAIITRMNILVCGNTVSNLKIFLSWVFRDTLNNYGNATVFRYKAEPFGFEETVFLDVPINDISIATDNLYPASTANPYSIGILYSKHGSSDTIIFQSSSNGGLSFDNRRIVSITGSYYNKVSLAYGRSSSNNSGRYFAAWEEVPGMNSTGHIVTAHSEPFINSSFTSPVYLDNLDPLETNRCKNPSIECQSSNFDNDSLNFTEVILYDRYNPSNSNYDIKGCYTMQPTGQLSGFRHLNITDSIENTRYPCIAFNPFDSTFMVTYYNSTAQKLPFRVNNFNLTSPNQWQIVSPGYNDNTNLYDPYPRVFMNYGLHTGAALWNAGLNGANGIAMFDAVSNTWAVVPETNINGGTRLIDAYPNPCTTTVTMKFISDMKEHVTITLYDILGNAVKILANELYLKGDHQVRCDLSGVPPGYYVYILKTGDYSKSGKIVVVR